MAQHQEDMSKVADAGELAPEGWYQVRIAKVTEGESKTGNPVVNLQLKVQNEGPMTGRMLFDTCSLQPSALFSLKAYYTAVGYKPAPGQGHDPDNILDGECWVKFEHKMYDGSPRGEIKPYNVRSLQQGPSSK